MPRTTRRARLGALLAIVTSTVVLVAVPVAAETSKAQVTKFTVTLTSQQTVLHQVGADGQHTYGWNQLTGTGSSDSGDIGVELLGNVQYTKGQGPFFGFVTMHFASLADVGFRLVGGKATKDSDGVSHFTAAMKVIGGTGALNTAKGSGTFTGSRTAELGSPVAASFTIRITGVDIG